MVLRRLCVRGTKELGNSLNVWVRKFCAIVIFIV